jgi:hypothetical protein
MRFGKRVGGRKTGVTHAQRGDELVLEVGVQRLSADLLNDHTEQNRGGVPALESVTGWEPIRLREPVVQQFVWSERLPRVGEHRLLERR